MDEAKLDFINGFAYADGKMIVQDETSELEYACSGIINQNLGSILKTNLENIVIVNNQFYNVVIGEYVIPKFESINIQYQGNNEIYFVTDKLNTEEICDEYIERKYEDLWNFQMNAQL